MDTQTIISLIESQKESIKSFGVKQIGVFGSQIRGDTTLNSDIDILIDFEEGKKTYRNFIGTSAFLEKIFNHPVDLVTSSSISPYIKPYIDKDIQYAQI